MALTLQYGYPRIGIWWPNRDDPSQGLEKRARFDYIEYQAAWWPYIEEVKSVNPDCIIMSARSARELPYNPDEYDDEPGYNHIVQEADNDWIMTQVGSVTTAAINSTVTTIPVADGTKFEAGELVVIEQELALINSIEGNNLYVTRQIAKPAAAHTSGVRIATACSGWENAFMLDITTDCPQRDVGHGLETAAQFVARLTNDSVSAHPWDGMLMDSCTDGWILGWFVSSAQWRNIDLDRDNVADDLDYIEVIWNAGMYAMVENIRDIIPPEKVLLLNEIRSGLDSNGRVFENAPRDAWSYNTWRDVVIGPWVDSPPRNSYLEFCQGCPPPIMSTMLTYEYQGNEEPPEGWELNFIPDYRKMRFGLTTALMGGGFYCWEVSTFGHAYLGIWWFDEFDDSGNTPYYLGYPTGNCYEVSTHCWRRDFDNGVAIVNPDLVSHVVELGGTYRKLLGTQCPTVNDGSTVTSVTIPAQDGIILLNLNQPVRVKRKNRRPFRIRVR